MSYSLQRKWGIFLFLLISVFLLLSSIFLKQNTTSAQSRQTPIPATAQPTTSPLEIIGVDNEVNLLVDLWRNSGTWVLLIVFLSLTVLFLRSYFNGLLEAVKNRGTKAGERSLAILDVLGAQGGVKRSVSAYLEWLKAEYSWTQPLGITTEQVQLDIMSVHIPLRTSESSEIEQYLKTMHGEVNVDSGISTSRSLIDIERSGVFALLSDPSSVGNILPIKSNSESGLTTRRLLLLGDAGSGKTTTLRYAALRIAETYLADDYKTLKLIEQELGLSVRTAPLPIYVRLTLFAATLPSDINQLSIQDRAKYTGAPPELFLNWLDQEARKLTGVPLGVLSSQITWKRANILFLLDGLDEAGDEERRIYIAELISNLAKKYPTNRYVVASRTAGYGGRVFLEGFIERHLSPLNNLEAFSLINKWFRAVDIRLKTIGKTKLLDNADEQSARLWEVIENNERLLEMATNPLLVTAMALLQFNNVRLPDQRARLYERLVELLLDLWRKQQTGNDTLYTSVSVARLATEQRRIEMLALNMQQQSQQVREVSLEQVQKWLSPLYMNRLQIDREAADIRVQELLNSLALESGLIQLRERGYSFSHYTFQEYLAARALDGVTYYPDSTDSVSYLLANSDDTRWRETLLLAAGHWSNGQQLTKTELLLRGLLERNTPQALLLTGDALVDVGDVEELTNLRGTAIRALNTLAFDANKEAL